MSLTLWQQCLARLQDELPATEFSMWIRPLQAELNDNTLALYAPNRFVLDWVRDKYLNSINALLNEFCGANVPLLRFEVGTRPVAQVAAAQPVLASTVSAPAPVETRPAPAQLLRPSWDSVPAPADVTYRSNVNNRHNFDNFVEGKSNQLARAAARQVADNPGGAYNPLFLYGGTGLGKTHLLHAVGNGIIARKPNAKVVYMHSERFVQDMVKALQNNAIEEFKRYYRSVDALLIDDIQFFANKERSQEEFFHTFNALLEGNQQIILTSDRYPKEINGVEDRLKSRFGWGLTVAIEPPELETRVAILMKKADENDIRLPGEVAARFAGAAGEAGYHRQHPKNRSGILQNQSGGFAVETPVALCGATASNGDGDGKGADQPQSARNWRCVWWPGPYHRAARLPEN